MRKKPGEGEREAEREDGATAAAEQERTSGTTTSEEQPSEERTSEKQASEKQASGKQASGKQATEEPKSRKKRDGGERAAKPRGEAVAKTRTRVAQLVWLLFVLAALFLAVGALCVALGANKDNGAVRFILDGAKFFDLGIFSRSNGIKTFDGSHAAIKNALFNWGIAAVLYLVIGRVVERIIRP